MIHNYVLTMKGESAKGYISTIPFVSGYFSVAYNKRVSFRSYGKILFYADNRT